MNRRISLAYAIALLACSGPSLYSQASPIEESDSLQTYRMGEVVVYGDSVARVAPGTLHRVPYSQLRRTDAATAAGIAYQIPAARIQTNSRGESLMYIRAAAERQVALFFDGALMNVPWDNRLDLSLLPLGAVGGITVAKGVPSVLYGPNTLGGAVNMVSLDRREPGFATEIQSQAGSNGLFGGSLVHMGNMGSLRYVGEVGYTSRDGLPLPDGADLPFNQIGTDLRTNTDLRAVNFYLRGENKFSELAEVGMAVHYIDSEKGVAPEGHLEDGARFWRYPAWQGLTISLNSEVIFGTSEEWSFKGAAWGTSFSQDIAQFEDATYSLLTAQEEDRDFTLGTRLVLRRALGAGGVTLALNGLSSNHDQRDFRYDSTGSLIERRDATGTLIPYPTATYRQQIYSAGLEVEQSFEPVTLTLGASYDGQNTPLTGDKPSQDPFSDYSVVGGVVYDLGPTLALRASGGRKTRFPTMRELYGEALRRFLINPDLKPEESWVTEAGVEGRGEWGALSVVGFSYQTSNLIDQRNFDTPGGSKRQRINLPGSRAFGGEVTGTLRALAPFHLDGHIMYAHARGYAPGSNGSDSTFALSEKPEILSTITAEYRFDFGLTPSLEIAHTGLAYSPNNDNEMIRLEPSTVFNVRVAYRFNPWGESIAQVYARVNNVSNRLVQSQLGLPGAGREVVGGIKISL